jgi:hypothetical protein
MKEIIKKILKESSSEKIIDILKRNGLNIFDYHGILNFLNELGFEKNESEIIFRNYSGIIGKPIIEFSDDNYVRYELELIDGFIEIEGHLNFYHSGRAEEHEFEPDFLSNKESEIYYDYNWEMVEDQINDEYAEIQYQKHRKK